MTNRIDQTFSRLKKQKRKALVGYVTAGFPNKKALATLVPLLEKSGLDILELGVPFSDPIADGPTIQRASQVALAQGTTLSWILSQVKSLRRTVKLPIILMSYSNPIFAVGVEAFFRACKNVGVDGLIIPDLIPEESGYFDAASRKYGVHLIYLVAPTTPSERIKQVARATRGFLYAVSLTGVTGTRKDLPKDVVGFLDQVHRASPCPVAVGFGISTPEQVRRLRSHVDGIIVGSALIHAVEKSDRRTYRQAGRYVASLAKALNS